MRLTSLYHVFPEPIIRLTSSENSVSYVDIQHTIRVDSDIGAKLLVISMPRSVTVLNSDSRTVTINN